MGDEAPWSWDRGRSNHLKGRLIWWMAVERFSRATEITSSAGTGVQYRFLVNGSLLTFGADFKQRYPNQVSSFCLFVIKKMAERRGESLE
jgi:hypothetical protein